MKRENLLYLGNYLDEDIIQERGLPTRNVAGTNRMNRIGQAFNCNFNTTIVSPAVSLRIRRNRKSFFLPARFATIDDIAVEYSSSISIPFLCLLFSYCTFFKHVISTLVKKKVKYVVIYNFDPLMVIISTVIKVFFPKVTIINNIEDISIPKLSDFKRSSEDRGLQQYIFYFCMKYIASISHAYIIPTKRFINFLPKKKKIIVITGCIPVNSEPTKPSSEKVRVLFSGKIEYEHGIDIFIKSMNYFDKSDFNKKFVVDISGGGDKVEWLQKEISKFKFLQIKYHGFVSNQKYKELLKGADVCVALQKDKGRHAQFKTPSKVYEYLGNSKIVIATDVGDLKELGDEIIKICKPLNSENMINILESVLNNKSTIENTKKNVYTFAKHNFDVKNVGERLKNEISL